MLGEYADGAIDDLDGRRTAEDRFFQFSRVGERTVIHDIQASYSLTVILDSRNVFQAANLSRAVSSQGTRLSLCSSSLSKPAVSFSCPSDNRTMAQCQGCRFIVKMNRGRPIRGEEHSTKAVLAEFGCRRTFLRSSTQVLMRRQSFRRSGVGPLFLPSI